MNTTPFNNYTISPKDAFTIVDLQKTFAENQENEKPGALVV